MRRALSLLAASSVVFAGPTSSQHIEFPKLQTVAIEGSGGVGFVVDRTSGNLLLDNRGLFIEAGGFNSIRWIPTCFVLSKDDVVPRCVTDIAWNFKDYQHRKCSLTIKVSQLNKQAFKNDDIETPEINLPNYCEKVNIEVKNAPTGKHKFIVYLKTSNLRLLKVSGNPTVSTYIVVNYNKNGLSKLNLIVPSKVQVLVREFQPIGQPTTINVLPEPKHAGLFAIVHIVPAEKYNGSIRVDIPATKEQVPIYIEGEDTSLFIFPIKITEQQYKQILNSAF